MFQIGTYKTSEHYGKNNPDAKGRWETGGEGKPQGKLERGGCRYHGQRQPRSVSAPRRASSPAFQEREEYCCLLNSSVSVGSLRRWGGTFRGGYIFFFTPVFLLKRPAPCKEKKKSSVEIRALAR